MKRRQFLNALALGTPALALFTNLRAATSPASTYNDASVQWLKKFNGQSTGSVLYDTRLQAALARYFPSTTAPFWAGRDIPAMVKQVLSLPERVSVEHHRFVHVTGRLAHFGRDRGMLWIDTHYPSSDPRALAALVTVMVTPSKGNQFWFVINRDTAYLSTEALPHNLRMNIARWIRSEKIRINALNVLDVKGQSTSQPIPELFGVPGHRYFPLAA